MIKKQSEYFQPLLDTVERSPRFVIWIGVLCALILLAGYAILASVLTSMEILEFSVKIPWATMIATYIFLVAIGCTAMSIELLKDLIKKFLEVGKS